MGNRGVEPMNRSIIIALTVYLGSVLAVSAEGANTTALCTNVCYGGGMSCSLACPPLSCNAAPANIATGQLLQLDVNSLSYQHGGFPPAAPSAAACCAACSAAAGCDAFVFCNDSAGCGREGECSAYIASLGAGKSGAPLGFGQFGGGCTADGRFPYQMCSLKRVGAIGGSRGSSRSSSSNNGISGSGSGTAAPALGFISGAPGGTVQPGPPGCPPSLSAYACGLCASGGGGGNKRDTAGCLACALRQSGAGANADGGVKAARACAVCAGFATAPTRNACFECVGGAKPCAACLQPLQQQQQQQPAFSEACFSCVAKSSATSPAAYDSTACAQCAPSGSNGAAAGSGVGARPAIAAADVGACLDCAVGGAPASRAACGGCYAASSAAARARCLACAASVTTSLQGAACGACAAPAGNATAAQCYACVANKGSAASADFCAYPRPGMPAAAAPYYGCLYRTKFGVDCPACVNGALSAEGAVTCLDSAGRRDG